MMINAIRSLIEDWRMYRRQRDEDHGSMEAIELEFECQFQKYKLGVPPDGLPYPKDRG